MENFQCFKIFLLFWILSLGILAENFNLTSANISTTPTTTIITTTNAIRLKAKLLLHISKMDLIVGERVQIEIKLSSNLSDSLSVQPNYEWNHPLLKCVNCDYQPLQYTTQSARFEWTCTQPGMLTVFFTAHPKPLPVDGDRFEIQENFVKLRIGRSNALYIVSWIFGWGYVLAWSCALYPQIVTNYQRKSVIGLSFDSMSLSLISFFSYSVFTASFLWIPLFGDTYRRLHPHSNIPVQINDVFFPLHYFALLTIKVVQCCVYERGNQRISNTTQQILLSVCSPALVLTVMLVCDQIIQPLAYIYYFSYIKIILTAIKYTPQAIFNYRRKSTEGFAILQIFLDFIGSTLCIGQMTCLAINFADTSYFTYNYSKLGIALISQFFDVIFIVQHYWLYCQGKRNEIFF